MATVRHSVTGRVSDLTGEPFVRAARAYIRTDLPANEYLTDLTTGGLQLGVERIDIADDGSFEIANLIATDNDPADVNWVDFHYQVVVTIPNLNAQPGTILTARTPWFALEADVDINDVIASDYAPPTAVSALLATITADVAAASASASSAATSAASALASKIAAEAAEAAAEEIAGLTGEDDAVAFLITHPSDTQDALSDFVAGVALTEMAADTVDTDESYRVILFSNGTCKAIPFATPDPVAPTSLAATSDDVKVTVTWTHATAPTTGRTYLIYRNGTLIGSSTTTSYQDFAVISGTPYTYRAKTVDAYGQTSALSVASNTVTPSLAEDPSPPIYELVVTAHGPTAYWRLIDFTDSSGNGHTLTPSVGHLAEAASLVGEDEDAAILFDDTGVGTAQLTTPDVADLRVGSGAYSVECWLTPGLVANFNIVSKAGDFGLRMRNNGMFKWVIYGDSWEGQIDSTVLYTLDETVHVVGVWNPTTHRAKIYVNGELDVDVSTASWGYTPTTSGWGELSLGYNDGLPSFAGLVDAVLDEVAIYDFELTADQVAMHYGAGTGATTAIPLPYPDASNSPYMTGTTGSEVLHYFPNFPYSTAEATQALTTVTGEISTTANNQVIENLYLDGGTIHVQHHNVTIRRCYLKCDTEFFTAVNSDTGLTLATSTNYHPTVEDCVIDGNNVPGGTGLAGLGLTVRRCNIFACDNGGQGEDEQTWEFNFLHDSLSFAIGGDEAHTDGIQFDNGPDFPVRNWRCYHNTILSRTSDGYGTTSCIITNQAPHGGSVMANIDIVDNVFAGGAFAIYGPLAEMGSQFVLRDNKFWDLYYPSVAAFGESGNSPAFMDERNNSIGRFSGGLVDNEITGTWVHDYYLDKDPDGVAKTDTSSPTPVGSLTVTATTADTVTVTWTVATDNVGVTHYVWRADNEDGSEHGYGYTGSTSPTYTYTGLEAETDYTLFIYARDAAGNRGSWRAVSATTASATAPVNAVAPAITGTAQTGETVSCSSGTWAGTPTPTFTYQWQRDTGGGFSNIGGATSSSYELAGGDEDNDVRCVVTATNAAGSASANSNTITPAAGSGYEAAILADDPTGYWRLADLTDASGNAHTLTVGSGTVSDVASLITDTGDGAKKWDASGTSYLTTADASDLRLGSTFSLEAWVKVDTVGNYGIVAKAGDYTLTVAGSKFRFTPRGASGWFTDCDSTTTVANGSTYHVVGTWNFATKIIKIYVNGTLENTVDASSFGYAATSSGWGAMNVGYNSAFGFTGAALTTIDELAIYDTVLDATAVSDHYAAGT